MKTIKNILFFILCFLLISCKKNDVEHICEERIKARLEYVNIARPADSYNYPVYPGMPEWSEFTTAEEMIVACQVPENILNEMSTQAIIQAIWEYPFVPDVFARYQYQVGFDEVFSENSAYNALTNRNDAGIALLERLKSTNPLMSRVDGEPKFLEILTSQGIFLSQLNEIQKKALIEIALENDNLRQDCGEANNNRASVGLLIGKLLKNVAYEPFIDAMNNNEQLKSFIEDTDYIYIPEGYGNIPQLIIDFANEYIK
ncbi:MAG: hypothetical protein LBF90_05195 [Prevotellaceae bacterium]|jgi:hypothetical protein|nr:hypothetical protein [Prevotellaceae bacterium]